jgi:hypothetical protein
MARIGLFPGCPKVLHQDESILSTIIQNSSIMAMKIPQIYLRLLHYALQMGSDPEKLG